MNKQILISALVFAGIFFQQAYATPPCRFLTKEEFKEEVYKPSDLVIEAEAWDTFIDNPNKNTEQLKFKVINIIKGTLPSNEITLSWYHNWFSKGDKYILLLQKNAGGYSLTPSSSGCQPSIIKIVTEAISNDELEGGVQGINDINVPGGYWSYLGGHGK